MMEILSRNCVANDGRSRRPMCLSPKQGVRGGHTYWGTAGEGTQRAALHHVAAMRYTRGRHSAAEKASCLGNVDNVRLVVEGLYRKAGL